MVIRGLGVCSGKCGNSMERHGGSLRSWGFIAQRITEKWELDRGSSLRVFSGKDAKTQRGLSPGPVSKWSGVTV